MHRAAPFRLSTSLVIALTWGCVVVLAATALLAPSGTALAAPLATREVWPARDAVAIEVERGAHFERNGPGWYGADGRVFKTRTVYENGKVLHQDFFASHYAPVWGGPLVDPDPPKP